MCGRYSLSSPADLLAEAFELETVPELAPRFNIAPTQEVAVVRRDLGDELRRLELVRWGLVPRWAKDPAIGSRLINARAETVAEKPSFRSSFRRQRCLVPADGFFEWRRKAGGAKEPVWFSRRDGRPFAIAGLWARWPRPEGGELESCTLITVRANPLVAEVHPRMPVILEPSGWDRWLDPELDEVGPLQELLVPSSAPLCARVVSPLVNRVGHDGPEILEPAEEEPQGRLF